MSEGVYVGHGCTGNVFKNVKQSVDYEKYACGSGRRDGPLELVNTNTSLDIKQMFPKKRGRLGSRISVCKT